MKSDTIIMALYYGLFCQINVKSLQRRLEQLLEEEELPEQERPPP